MGQQQAGSVVRHAAEVAAQRASRESRARGVTPKQRANVESDRTALLVPLDAIVPGPNSRTGWDEVDDGLLQLAESIRERGLLEPLIVRELRSETDGPRRFQLLAGFRRLAAARHLQMRRVPVRVVASSDAEARATNVAENLARTDLTDADAVRAIEDLHVTHGWGVRQIARTSGRPASWISDLLTVARSRREREALQDGRIALNAAVRVARLKEAAPELRDDLLRRVEAGERVLVGDVPRIQAVGPGKKPRDGQSAELYSEAPTPDAAPDEPPRDEDAQRPAAVGWVEYVEYGRIEQAMYRNMRLSIRQVLVALDKTWEAQGRHRRLPLELRRELEQTREFLDEFLNKDTAGR